MRNETFVKKLNVRDYVTEVHVNHLEQELAASLQDFQMKVVRSGVLDSDKSREKDFIYECMNTRFWMK